jgi:hypothetical protein
VAPIGSDTTIALGKNILPKQIIMAVWFGTKMIGANSWPTSCPVLLFVPNTWSTKNWWIKYRLVQSDANKITYLLARWLIPG